MPNQGAELIDKILSDSNAIYTVHNHPVFGQVLDVEVPGQTGARWSTDGSKFIGFLDP
jgi:hypothetical protein